MSYKKLYTRELNNLFKRRTKRLRDFMGIKKQGKAHNINKIIINKSIIKLQNIISATNSKKYFNNAIKNYTFDDRRYHLKGFGYYDKVRKFKNWFNDTINYKNIVYIFWNKKTCLYVGRTKGGANRPTSHLDTHKTKGWTRVNIYLVNSKSYLPMIECLAIHNYIPKHNRIKPANPKWTKSCPICKEHRLIKQEINDIFK